MEAGDYDSIRQRVEERFRQRTGFYAHLAVYTLVSIVLWVVWGFTSGMAWQIAQRFPIIGDLSNLLTMPWPLIVMGGWGIGLVAHAINYYSRYGGGAIRREIAIQREIEREMARDALYTKPKNDAHMRLTDDGELEEITADDYEVQKAKRN